jgi:hypothetical protein
MVLRGAGLGGRAFVVLALAAALFGCPSGPRLEGGDDAGTIDVAETIDSFHDAADATDELSPDAEPDDGVDGVTDASHESDGGDAETDTYDPATTDTDGDTISDLDEGDLDTDSDTVPDYLDLDSDGDTIPDAVEAGDTDLATPPASCDADVLPNFRDPDSDNDCLGDYDERSVYGTDPCNVDTDGDGFTDFFEIAIGSDPLDPADSPRTRRDLIYVMPYLDDPIPWDDVLVFSTSLQRADVYFLLDVSATMAEELAAFRASIATTIIPGILAAIPDTWFGLGHFSDYPLAPYGAAGDEAYANDQPLTADLTAVRAAADALGVQDGGDGPDSQVPALHALATGMVDRICPRPSLPVCAAGGHPCFRPDAVPLVVLITDSTFHSGPGETDPYGTVDTGTCTAFHVGYEDARSALVAEGIKVLGVEAGGTAAARAQLEQLVTDTGAIASRGAIVWDVPATGVGLGTAISEAVQEYTYEVPIAVRLVAVDDPSDEVDAVAAFIDTIEPEPSGVTGWDPATGSWRACTVLPAADGDGDTIADHYPSVLPGTSVCFRIRLRMNTTVPWDEVVPQLFRATLEARTGRDAVLDSRDVFFLVLPRCGMTDPTGGG